jgi:hypothetical protein
MDWGGITHMINLFYLKLLQHKILTIFTLSAKVLFDEDFFSAYLQWEICWILSFFIRYLIKVP